MIYIIQGQEEYFIRERIAKIIKESDGEIFHFDGMDKSFDIDQLLEACQGNSLFSSGYVVLVDQPYFLVKKSDEKNLQPLFDYISKPVFENQLIFYTYLNNFNQRLKAFKQISENAQVITLNSLDYKNFNNYVRSRLVEEDLKLDNESIFLLSNLCKRSATLLNQNIEY